MGSVTGQVGNIRDAEAFVAEQWCWIDQEPMEVDEGWFDVLPGSGMGQNSAADRA